jgi:hypothetical protein
MMVYIGIWDLAGRYDNPMPELTFKFDHRFVKILNHKYLNFARISYLFPILLQ